MRGPLLSAVVGLATLVTACSSSSAGEAIGDGGSEVSCGDSKCRPDEACFRPTSADGYDAGVPRPPRPDPPLYCDKVPDGCATEKGTCAGSCTGGGSWDRSSYASMGPVRTIRCYAE